MGSHKIQTDMGTTGSTLSMGKIKWLTISGLLLGAILFYWGFKERLPHVGKDNLSYDISGRWELPSELREISAIDWLDNSRIGAVQDEEGTIFIYDLNKKGITDKIEFGLPGDYEGLAIAGKDAYVLESNGRISEIKNFLGPDRTVDSYETFFNSENNMETLELDVDRNRLLMAPKDRDPNSGRSKGIYTFSLDSKKVDYQPAFKIDMGDKVLRRFGKNDLYRTFRPSDLAIRPQTKEIYVLEGSQPKLLILDADGNAKAAYTLDKKVFPRPEGITFGADGTLFISSEGKKGASGTLTQLKLHQ